MSLSPSSPSWNTDQSRHGPIPGSSLLCPERTKCLEKTSVPEQGFHKHTHRQTSTNTHICRLLSPGPQVMAVRSPLGEGRKGRALRSSYLPPTNTAWIPRALTGCLPKKRVSWQWAEKSQKTQSVRSDSSRAVGSRVLLTGSWNRPQHEENSW